MPSIILPDGYRFVGAAVSSTFLIASWQALLVTSARKRAGIKYPQLYAEKAEAEANKDAMIFNCTQRAHQNVVENISIINVSTLLLGVKYPILAATLCGVWSLSRIPYTVGYTTGDPAQVTSGFRRAGVLSTFGPWCELGLIVTSMYVWGRAAVTGTL